MRLAYVVLPTVLLVGCASNPAPVQLSPGTYLISREDKGGIFGNPSALKAAVVSDANTFASSKGMVAIPITTHETPAYPLHFASFDYQFKLVPPGSPEARSTALGPVANIRVEEHAKTTVEVPSEAKNKSQDTYSELLKLDDLRKRGIITDEEFAEQKRKLLQGS